LKQDKQNAGTKKMPISGHILLREEFLAYPVEKPLCAIAQHYAALLRIIRCCIKKY